MHLPPLLLITVFNAGLKRYAAGGANSPRASLSYCKYKGSWLQMKVLDYQPWQEVDDISQKLLLFIKGCTLRRSWLVLGDKVE